VWRKKKSLPLTGIFDFPARLFLLSPA